MADTATRLKKLITSNAAVKDKIGDRMYLDRVPSLSDKRRPYIWFRRMSAAPIDTLDAAAGEAPTDETFEVEVISPVERETQQITDLIVKADNGGAALNGYRGAFDDTTCRGIFVTDREGGHAAKGIGENTGLFFTAFNVQIHL